jgi:cell wall-associated NlpC family hydrolase
MPINGFAASAVGAGILFTWSGIKGWAVLPTLGDIVTGKAPSQGQTLSLVSGSGSGGAAGHTGNAIADTFLKYKGHAYLYGGAPGRDGSKPWDCSSSSNWIASIGCGLAIPGYGPGKYDGSVHGPTTLSWIAWPGLRRISRADLAPGDFLVWAGHMGVYIGNNEMISASSPKSGTHISGVQNPNNLGLGPVLKYGRLG